MIEKQNFYLKHRPYRSVLRAQIKRRGDRRLRWPDNIEEGLMEVCEFVDGCEVAHGIEYHDKCFAHLTVDYALVPKGTHHRKEGWHTDGMDRHEITWIAATKYGTQYMSKPVDWEEMSKYDKFEQNMFTRMPLKGEVLSMEPGMFYRMDNTVAHRSPKAPFDTDRLVIRICYHTLPIHNPLKSYDPRRTVS